MTQTSQQTNQFTDAAQKKYAVQDYKAKRSIEGLEIVKQGVDQRGIFLRIDLDRLGRDARAATPPASSGTAGKPKTKRT